MRTLVIRSGAIGDCIVSLPAIDSIHADYKEVWTPSAVVPLIRRADRVDSIARTGLDLLGLPGLTPPPTLLERLHSFDRIVSWYGSNRPDFRSAVSDLPFEFHAALPAEGQWDHAVDFFLGQLGVLPSNAWPAIPLDPIPRGEHIVIHPFSGSPRKNWPLDRFRVLADQLPGVEWCAGPDEHLVNARRFDNLFDLAQWLAAARLYIGNDSGVSHLAAAVGTPTVAIFGPTDPRVWAPRGPRVCILESPSLDDAVSATLLMLQ